MHPSIKKKIEIFQKWKNAAYRGDFDSCIIITDNIREKIQWWELHVNNVMRNVLVPAQGHYTESDASNTGWGGILNPQINGHMTKLSYTSTSKS